MREGMAVSFAGSALNLGRCASRGAVFLSYASLSFAEATAGRQNAETLSGIRP
jgi:hypothetical protein